MLQFKKVDENTMEAVAPPTIIQQYVHSLGKDLEQNGFDIQSFVTDQIVTNAMALFGTIDALDVAIHERADHNYVITVTNRMREAEDEWEEIIDEDYELDEDEEYDNHPMRQQPVYTDFFYRDNKVLKSIDNALKWSISISFNTFSDAMKYLQAISNTKMIASIAKLQGGECLVLLTFNKDNNELTDEEHMMFNHAIKMGTEYNKICFVHPRQSIHLFATAMEHDNVISWDQPVEIFS